MLPALGLDYGQTHIGVALATGPLSEPLPALLRSQVLSQLPGLVEKHSIRTLVIGLPDGPVRSSVEDFVTDLKNNSALSYLTIVYQDESLSTHDAITSLLHVSPAQRKLREHSAAAAIILQNWLDSLPLGM